MEEAAQESRDDLSRASSFVSARTSFASSWRSSSSLSDAVTIRSDFSFGRHIGAPEIEEIPDYRYLPFTPSRRESAPPTPPTNIIPGSRSEAPTREINTRVWKDREWLGSFWHFSSKAILNATNNFDVSRFIEVQGDAQLYQGIMPGFQQPLAIRKNATSQGESDVINEIVILSKISHRNISKLIGACFEEGFISSVHEFYTNDLHTNLFNAHMPWEMRLRVATEVAGALTYLHSSISHPLVHRDINPSNIYLDADYTAKISGFHSASLATGQESCTVRGTFGYLDPEYLTTWRVTCKLDVYSFGVVLAQLLTRRQASDIPMKSTLASALISSMKEGRLHGILDVDAANADTVDQMNLVAGLAAKCLESKSNDRPTMAEVAMALEQIRIAGSSLSQGDLPQSTTHNNAIDSDFPPIWPVSNKKNSLYSKLLRWSHNRQKMKLHSIIRRYSGIIDGIERYKIFTINELKVATDNFDRLKILSGGKNIVYRGQLSDGTLCAIKESTDHESAEEILNEVKFLSQLRHKNILGLLGVCTEAKYPIIVVEYIANGSLTSCIQRNSILWDDRLKISIELARALSYMHTSLSIPVIHGDVKASNILLQEDYTVKIADFGFTSILRRNDESLFAIRGTPGNMDPEYLHTGKISCKSDVYSYGVVLYQLLMGITISYAGVSERESLVERLTCLMENNSLENHVDAKNVDEAIWGQINVVAKLALKCLSFRAEERPSMIEIARKLELSRSERHNDEETFATTNCPPVDSNSTYKYETWLFRLFEDQLTQGNITYNYDSWVTFEPFDMGTEEVTTGIINVQLED